MGMHRIAKGFLAFLGLLCVSTTSRAAAVQPHVLWTSPIGFQPIDVKTADLNHDGRPDVVVGASQNNVQAIANSGQQLWSVTTSDWPWHLSVGDVNGDGRDDMVAMGSQTGLKAISGTGAVLWSKSLPVTGSGNQVPEHVAIADVDGDGQNETIIAPNGLGIIRAYDTVGTIKWTYTVGFQPNRGGMTSLLLADLDGDHHPEILGTYGYTPTDPNGLVILNGNGSVRSSFPTLQRLGNVALGDLNGDGSADIVTGEWSDSSPQMLHARTIAGGALWDFPIVGRADDIYVADLDGDAINEVVVSSWDQTLRVINADGSLRWSKPIPNGIARVLLGDTDGNGRPEVIASSLDGTTYDFDSGGSTLWQNFTATQTVRDATVADMNGDGRDDVIVVAGDYGTAGAAYVLSVPEPSAISLLCLGALATSRRSQRTKKIARS
jgi:hypothetical protein